MHLSANISVFVSFIHIAICAAGYPPVDGSLVAHSGDPLGEFVDHSGFSLYVTKPSNVKAKQAENSTVGVLFLSDVYGIQSVDAQLLADSFARAGYITVAPDLFNGQPSTVDVDPTDPNAAEDLAALEVFVAAHEHNVTDPIVENAISYIYSLGIETIAAAGYCFGGRLVFRHLRQGGSVDVGFAAHPSLVTNDEVLNVTGPLSIAGASTDPAFSGSRRLEVESLLEGTGQPYSSAVYGGTVHGFGTHINVTILEEKVGKEEAFVQAVRFFQNWA